ncbi:MAG: 4-alpha-glucanotransferase [Planctomycetaceae bacterium]|nr:4-alpha-glucanotransferase [Planctomycetaceae bacterium]
MKNKASGILLHITSLPSRFGIGDFGPQAFKFADFLQKSGQTYWQILPLTPPNRFKDWSPYDSLSAFAGNTMLISPEFLYKAGLLNKADISNPPAFSKNRVEFKKVFSYKSKLFDKAFNKFKSHSDKKDFKKFCRGNKYWLDDYSVFAAMTEEYKTSDWAKWSEKTTDDKIKQCVEKEKFLQYLFFKQWFALKEYCNVRGIKIIGDIPIYVAYQSADVWAHRDIFKLRNKKPIFKAGVPPDYFSKTGQLWGNPIYDWARIKKTNYQWPMQRFGQNLKLFDVVRIDHFRGLVKYWQIPGKDKTAINGKWMPGPGEDFFNTLFKNFPNADLIVEDLGHITKDVKALIKKLNLTGMKVLQFAFDDNKGKSEHLPSNYTENSVVYTGTHDNNTIRGWFTNEAEAKKKKNLFRYLGKRVPIGELNWELIGRTMASAARVAIFPVQDILNLGQQSRMNNPAKRQGNWRWRLKDGLLTAEISRKLSQMTQLYRRG